MHESFFADPHHWVYIAFLIFVVLFGMIDAGLN